ncbi:hypothetical protein C4J98_4170 [Pseudomonas orientalis]|nr:hypothetical protein C4J98_4170 [Pseudomonas orientalis]
MFETVSLVAEISLINVSMQEPPNPSRMVQAVGSRLAD